MRVNENTAISTTKVLLVPYDRRHAPKYHAWMEDPAIQEATASEPLSLAEEYENQQSWRAASDKLTFILCQPTAGPEEEEPPDPIIIRAGHEDRPERMLGDINFILHPDERANDGANDDGQMQHQQDGDPASCVGEIDIMIADPSHRGKGLGTAAARALLHYVMRNKGPILAEYGGGRPPKPRLARLMAKIKAGNSGSIALFRSLGFVQEGGLNYFGEVQMGLGGGRLDGLERDAPDGYVETIYSRDGKGE